jgi:rhodanese-related sulfurtransferase
MNTSIFDFTPVFEGTYSKQSRVEGRETSPSALGTRRFSVQRLADRNVRAPMVATVLAWILTGLASAWGMSPAELQQHLAAGEKLTLIDVRPTGLFQQGHIPGAINVPAAILAEKRLPQLGRVIVYDGGLGQDLATTAVAALNTKPGVSAQALDGGLAAWENAKGATTAPPGLSEAGFPQITYDKLKAAAPEDVVLVDLRKSAAPAKTAAGQVGAPLTDLSTEFPNVRVTPSPFAVSSVQKTAVAGAAKPPLLVLIDSGDGAAREMARTLKANGVKRFVILAGGEAILARKGQPGLQRAGSSLTLPGSVVSTLTNTNQ